MKSWKIHSKSRLFVLTGAGVSAESGVKTFRDSGGLWEGHDVMEVATPEGFARQPELVLEFYNQRRRQLFEVEPNKAHFALAECAKRMGSERFFLVTQNVDDLHERGGSPAVHHMHGELRKLECVGREKHVLNWDGPQNSADRCPNCGAKLRPHIVWFGEIPFGLDEIEERLLHCSHFLYIGTSSLVYPAANFKRMAKKMGAEVMCVNLEVNSLDSSTDYFFEGKAGEILPDLMEEWK